MVQPNFEKCPVVPVVVIKSIEETIPTLQALMDGGVPVAEITFRTACAADAIREGVKNFPEMNIGAGTIITRRERVKGLTTAAGLWASAIVGLAIGAGFYEGAVIATVLIILAEWIFARLEYWLLDNAPEANLYIEYENKSVCSSHVQPEND